MRARILVALLLLGAAAVPLAYANPSGVGDGTRSSDCGSACHRTTGASSLQIWSPDSEPQAGAEVLVLVLLRPEWPSAETRKVGVFLVTRVGSGDNRPGSEGWSILEDPDGGTGNYVEQTLSGGTWHTLEWRLLAPTTAGTYTLHSVVNHGGGSPRVLSTATPATFEVAGGLLGQPVIAHTPVAAGNVGQAATFEATIANATAATLFTRTDGVTVVAAMTRAAGDTSLGSWELVAELPREVVPFEYWIRAENGTLASETAHYPVSLHVPDLVAESLEVEAGAVGTAAVARVRVHNANALEVAGFAVEFLVEGAVVASQGDLTIPANATLTYAAEWVPDRSGEVTVTVRVDSEAAILEADEENNVAAQGALVVPTEPPQSSGAALLLLPLVALGATAAGVLVLGRRKDA